MKSLLAGIPFWAWGLVCLVVAAVYAVVLPKNMVATGWAYVVLRWFHSLVWVLMAAACFTRAGFGDPGKQPAKYLALAGLAAYLIFLITFLTQRK